MAIKKKKKLSGSSIYVVHTTLKFYTAFLTIDSKEKHEASPGNQANSNMRF